MIKTVFEHDKKRTITIDREYSYKEAIHGPDSDEYIEFFSMVKGDDYSFYYINGTDEVKVGRFLVEVDSIFYKVFNKLLKDDNNFVINDDYSDRYIEFFRDELGNVVIEFHLLEEELDGTVELKNIMLDFRSSSDALGKDTKSRLAVFFDELLCLENEYASSKKLIKI